MSRSALWRQEGNVKERERRAEELFAVACAEGRARSKSTLPLWGPDNDTFHFNPLLLKNTIHSQYFQTCCTKLLDWNAIIDEIYYEVNHLQVFQIGGGMMIQQPSTAFCLLLRLLCLRMTAHELDQTLRHADSPYIRAIGFLFVRYGGCPAEQVYTWIQPYLQEEEEEEFVVEQATKTNTVQYVTMGEYVRTLFQSRDYYGATPLPRFPATVERDLQVQLLSAEKIAQRAAEHVRDPATMRHFHTVGSKVMALYGDAENPVTWYKAVVDRVITRTEDERPLKYPKFIVTFPEYGNTETVTLGEMDMIGGASSSTTSYNASRKRDRSSSAGRNEHRRGGTDVRRSRRGYGRGYDDDDNNNNYNRGGSRSSSRDRQQGGDDDLYEEVRRRERDTVTSTEKGHWARRPPSTKASLAASTFSHRQRRVEPEDDDYHHRPITSQRRQVQHEPTLPPPPRAAREPSPPVRKRSPEELAAIAEKKRKLMSKYG